MNDSNKGLEMMLKAIDKEWTLFFARAEESDGFKSKDLLEKVKDWVRCAWSRVSYDDNFHK